MITTLVISLSSMWNILVLRDFEFFLPTLFFFFSTCGKCALNFDDDDDGLNVQRLFHVVSSSLSINCVYLFFPLQSSLHIYFLLFRQKPFDSMQRRPWLIVEKTSDIPPDMCFLQHKGSYFPLIICQMSSMYNCRKGMAMSSFSHMTIDY